MRLRVDPRFRLGLLVVGLVALFVAVSAGVQPSPEGVRDAIEPYGALAPVVYVAACVALGLALVPGPLLAGAGGLLFGPAQGFALALLAATLHACAALHIARRTGREGLEELQGERMARLADWLRRNGLAAVVVQRLAPWVPDAPCSYAAGAVGIRTWQIALGTLIGAAPRAFAYSALGGSLDDLSSPLAVVAVVVLGVTALTGLVLARRAYRQERAAAPADV